MFDSNSNIRTTPLFLFIFCLFPQQHYAEKKKSETRDEPERVFQVVALDPCAET